ncbi:MAG: hypothetical protein EPO40_19700 [Myxococcaceae bacterium]|nr:MAG: hypothetical protein EPO40_19700 [Myxococcaceae bacterium]
MAFRRQPKRPRAAPTDLTLIDLCAPTVAPSRAQRRRKPPSPGAAEVRGHLERPWLLDPGLIEGTATKAHEDGHLRDAFDRASGDVLSARLGYLVLKSEHAACGGGCLLERTLVVKPSADELRWNLRVLHELAHALLEAQYAETGKRFAESDAWALTLALAVPRKAFKRRHEARHVPRWAVALRAMTAKVVMQAA